MNKPTVYIQDADGTEVELQVLTPDPEDGTFTCFVPEGTEVLLTSPDNWIRIVPNLEGV